MIWTSPPLPESSIVARKDLDPAIKEKMRQFFLTYGVGTGPEADKQRAILKTLAYGGFKPADNTYLDPIREMEAAEALAARQAPGDAASDRRGPRRPMTRSTPPRPRSAPRTPDV